MIRAYTETQQTRLNRNLRVRLAWQGRHVVDLARALEAGSYDAGRSTLVKGAPLVIEDLYPVMQCVTFSSKCGGTFKNGRPCNRRGHLDFSGKRGGFLCNLHARKA